MPYSTFPQTSQAVVWGTISGNIASQTDLKSLLDSKASISHSHSDMIDMIELPVSFSKYGTIATGEFIFPFVLSLPEGYSAYIKSAVFSLGAGSLNASLQLNDTPVDELSDLTIDNDQNFITLETDVQLTNGDKLTLCIDLSEGSNSDLFFNLIIIIRK